MTKDDYLDKQVEHLSYHSQKQYQRDTKKMHQLDEEWQVVYERVLAFLDSDQEFIDREAEKGGRNEWSKHDNAD